MADAPLYIACMDAIEGMNRLRAQSIDVVVTSPPYNVGTAYGVCDDRRSYGGYLDWMKEWLRAISRVLKPRGSFFLNISGIPSDRRLPHDAAVLSRAWFRLQNEIHWIKSITIAGKTHGHFKPINSRRYLNDCHEYLFHFTLHGTVELDRLAIGVPYTDPSNLDRWRSAGKHQKRCGGNVWQIPYETVQRHEQKGHPAPFPLELPRRCLQLHGLPPRDLRDEITVLDPFLGIGTTLQAAAEFGCTGIGFDVDLDYVLEAALRLAEQTGRPVVVGKDE